VDAPNISNLNKRPTICHACQYINEWCTDTIVNLYTLAPNSRTDFRTAALIIFSLFGIIFDMYIYLYRCPTICEASDTTHNEPTHIYIYIHSTYIWGNSVNHRIQDFYRMNKSVPCRFNFQATYRCTAGSFHARTNIYTYELYSDEYWRSSCMTGRTWQLRLEICDSWICSMCSVYTTRLKAHQDFTGRVLAWSIMFAAVSLLELILLCYLHEPCIGQVWDGANGIDRVIIYCMTKYLGFK
jgi:hypothetical protein